MRKSRRNKSKSVKDGQVFQTRDNYLESGKDYAGKPKYGKRTLYRPVVVVATNRDDEMAVVRLTSKDKATKLPDNFRGRKQHVRPFVETKDNEGKAIKRGKKFRANREGESVTKNNLKVIQREAFRGQMFLNKDNRKKVRKLKGRKNKK